MITRATQFPWFVRAVGAVSPEGRKSGRQLPVTARQKSGREQWSCVEASWLKGMTF